MAKISRRLGRLGVDWRDKDGKRRWKTCKTDAEAKVFLGQVLIESGKQPLPELDITLAEYAQRWQALTAVRLRPRSLAIYRHLLDKHILPSLGLQALRDVSGPMLRDWLTLKARTMSRSTISMLLGVVSSMFALAVEDGIVERNPASGLWRRLRLSRNRKNPENVRAMSAEQLGRFLKAVQVQSPKYYLAFYTMAMTGLRVGEMLGLQWRDFDWGASTLSVERQFHRDGSIVSPKTPRSRRVVDVAPGLLRQLRQAHSDRQQEDIEAGRGETPWIYSSWPEDPPANSSHNARRMLHYTMRRALKKAGLPGHFSTHTLRHTYASLHLARGESPKYVQEQLGHESIQITVDVYGRWMPTRNPAAARELEDSVLRPKLA